MKKTTHLFLVLMALTFVVGACQKKREISIDKVTNIIQQSVIAEQADSGHRLVVDTIALQPAADAVYRGELRGSLDDSITVTYDLVVTDEGEDYDMEWTLAN